MEDCPPLRIPLLAGLALGCALLAPPSPGQRPNVLILLADDLGVDQVRAYGEGTAPPPTPTLDALASRGVLFRNAWADPTCSPTRACLHTGRYGFRTKVGGPLRVGSRYPGNVLPLSEVTLPELLDQQGSGYSHALIGKWHLGDARNGGANGPNLAGWSHFAGLLDGGLAAGQTHWLWPRTVDGQTAVSTTYTTTQIVDDALAWTASAPEPWLCMVAFLAPFEVIHRPPPGLHTQNLGELEPSLQPIPFFKAMVEALDTEIGRLLGSLGPRLSNTVVIFLADNGTPTSVVEPPFTTKHAKGTPYEGGVNVPLIVAGPAVASPGREVSALVAAVDVFATAAELCGVSPRPPGPALDAVSFVPYLTHPAQPPLRQTVFAERFFGSYPSTNGFATMRDGRFKVIRRYPQPKPDELYDLWTDPFETSNVLRRPLNPEQQGVYASLLEELERLRRQG